ARLKFTDYTQDHIGELEKGDDMGQVQEGQQTMLLFSSLGPEVMGMPLSSTSRVERINPNNIQLIGNREYIEFRGRSLRLIRPENYLPISRKEERRSRLYVIV